MKDGKEAPTYSPEATARVKEAIHYGVKRFRKVGLTTHVNQTGATLTSVRVHDWGESVLAFFSPHEEVNCIQTVSVSDLIQQGGPAGRVAPGEHYVMASEEQVANQFRGTSAPELLNADVAPFISICRRIEHNPLTFPSLNVPDRKGPGSYYANARVGDDG